MGYSTDNRKWAASECRLKLTSATWDCGWLPETRSAMKAWTNAGAQFKFVEDASASNDLGSYDLGRWNGWLAMTYTRPQPQGSSLVSAQILLNLYYEWDPAHPSVPHTDSGGRYDLETVLTHELGHVLHLDDDSQQSANTVMCPTIKPVSRRQIAADDIAGIKYLYP
jgi:hypothetical protein